VKAGEYLVLQGPDLTRDEALALMSLARARDIEPLPDGATVRAFRLGDPASRAGVAEAAAARRVDSAFVPADRRLADVRVVSMDMDSTLITIECNDEIADMLGI
jgi:phosphoserine phosphatase